MRAKINLASVHCRRLDRNFVSYRTVFKTGFSEIWPRHPTALLTQPTTAELVLVESPVFTAVFVTMRTVSVIDRKLSHHRLAWQLYSHHAITFATSNIMQWGVGRGLLRLIPLKYCMLHMSLT